VNPRQSAGELPMPDCDWQLDETLCADEAANISRKQSSFGQFSDPVLRRYLPCRRGANVYFVCRIGDRVARRRPQSIVSRKPPD
jgi:hypothetical protein